MEAKIVSRLDQPNVVKVLDLGRMDERWFIAMEYVAGSDLGALLEKMRERNVALSLPIAVGIATELLKGLHHAHTRIDSAGRPLVIVHRDVAPGNVLVSSTGEVKLTDFGIAKTAEGPKTAQGVVKGNLFQGDRICMHSNASVCCSFADCSCCCSCSRGD